MKDAAVCAIICSKKSLYQFSVQIDEVRHDKIGVCRNKKCAAVDVLQKYTATGTSLEVLDAEEVPIDILFYRISFSKEFAPGNGTSTFSYIRDSNAMGKLVLRQLDLYKTNYVVRRNRRHKH